MKPMVVFIRKKLKKKNSKWLPKEKLIFQFRQFSFFLKFFSRDWALGSYDELMRRALMWLNLYGRQAV
jgi:hypothetical protein